MHWREVLEMYLSTVGIIFIVPNLWIFFSKIDEAEAYQGVAEACLIISGYFALPFAFYLSINFFIQVFNLPDYFFVLLIFAFILAAGLIANIYHKFKKHD